MQTEQCTSLPQLAQSCVSLEAAAPPGPHPSIARAGCSSPHAALQASRRQGCRRLCNAQPRKQSSTPRPSIWARTASTNNGVSPPQAAKPVLDAPWTDMAHHHSNGFTQGHHLLQRQPKALLPPTRLRLFAGTANPVSQLSRLVLLYQIATCGGLPCTVAEHAFQFQLCGDNLQSVAGHMCRG